MSKVLNAIKQLIPNLKEEQYSQLASILDLAGYESAMPMDDSVSDDPEGMEPNGEMIKSVDVTRLATDLKSLGYTVTLPDQEAPKPTQRPAYSARSTEPKPDEGMKSIDAAYILRFGEEKSETKAILSDVIGPDYRQKVHEQNVAFGKYIRHGENQLDRDEMKSLKTMMFPMEQVLDLAKNGMAISDIKATQVEAQGELGGFSVPPNIQSEVTKRLPGRTAVRGGGARVVQLANSNSIEIPIYRGNTNRYIGLLRGTWSNETKNPDEQNIKLDLETIVAHVYTYKVPMSMSLVEDAANLVSILQEDIQDTMVIDEDEAFLIGKGAGKPRGILPGGLNVDNLTEVISESANAVTTNGIKKLKRGVPSQYRDNSCIWVGQSDTFGDIEVLTVGGGNLAFAFPDLSENESLLNRRVFESEAMPAIAANAYPLIFGNMRGYTIVERLGMTIQRFQDSNTGPNKVEYHVRRRLGGRIERPWMFAVQKIAAAGS